MGRLALVIDPDAPDPATPSIKYQVWDQPGFPARWTGRKLAENNWISSTQGFYSPGVSDWVMCEPLCFDASYYRSDMSPFTLPRSKWTFSTGVTARDFYPRRTPTYFNSTDVGMAITVPDTIGAAPINVRIDRLATACGVTFPTGTKVIGTTAWGISGEIMPFLEVARRPAPNDLIIFGFGDLALVWMDTALIICRTPNNDHQSWEVLRKFGLTPQRPNTGTFFGVNPTAIIQSSTQTNMKRLIGLAVGWTDIFLIEDPTGAPFIIPTRPEPSTADKRAGMVQPQVKTGPWWLACGPSQVLACGVQTVGFNNAGNYPEVGGTPIPDGPPPNGKIWFNLTQEYTPTLDAEVYADQIMVVPHGGVLSFPPLTNGNLTDVTIDSVLNSELSFQLLDELTVPWASDGTHFRGAVQIKMFCGDQPAQGSIPAIPKCYTPQFREIQFHFPTNHVDRVADPITLYDRTDASRGTVRSFKPGWEVEGSLHDHDGKVLRFELTATGSDVIRASGHLHRENMPVHLIEYTEADLSDAVVRARGWIVEGAEATELMVRGGVPVEHSKVRGKGLLMRCDEDWTYRAALVAPLTAGGLEHTDAMKEVLVQSGFDITDISQVLVGADSAEADMRILPGGTKDVASGAGQRMALAYEPDEDGTRLEYGRRLLDWRKWLWYEEINGKVIYDRDPVDDILDMGLTLTPAATFYASHAAATAAGFPGQVWESMSEEFTIAVVANRVRIIPCDPDMPQVFCQDKKSATDPTADNFIAQFKTKRMHPRMAVTLPASRQLSIFALRRWKRRRRRRTWKCHKAFWNIGSSGIDVGSIVVCQGFDTYQVIHLGTKGLARDKFVTTITGEVLPAGPVFGG
jgi:hypothetical protein